MEAVTKQVTQANSHSTDLLSQLDNNFVIKHIHNRRYKYQTYPRESLKKFPYWNIR